ncbi:PAS-domain containing protein [Paracoccus sediminicola]|uniref:PAS-domain containing protein n=1 Tax=Paracoccus sediminicola TaxID=3017783 RepID=UPI0022F00C8F|nr:PAS-domain containing protein [Paracoccus sediminicola]WBU56377.1 PAS-domain containing protein [Paracoccus sediminicola]
MQGLTMIVAALAGGALSVLLALLAIRWFDRPERPALLTSELVAPCIFLFRQNRLIDATAPAQAIMDTCPSGDLTGLKSWLTRHFDGLDGLDDHGTGIELLGKSGTGSARLRLLAEPAADGALRLTLVRPDAEAAGIVVDSLSQQAMEEELSLLRGMLNHAPAMIARRDKDGQVIWANARYLAAAERRMNDETSWPLPDFIEIDPNSTASDGARRARVDAAGIAYWFDCHEQEDDHGSTVYALPADATVRAEQSLREILQTLTKTFADLPIGLAIFDRERQLQLFNPALIDLTGLSAAFLSSRPSLFSVLDQLRELRMVPEPRDYRSWRKQITTLESAASAGHHVETWSLPGGRTYRVTGRPHPGGAVAFLFEDITSEITLARKFRAELTFGAQVLDGLDEALIVFNAVGQVVTTNQSYQKLWGDPPERINEALRIWRGDWDEAPGLERLEEELHREDCSGEGHGVLFGPDRSGVLAWTVRALPGGKRMLRFSQTSAAPTKNALVEERPTLLKDDRPESLRG